MNETKKISYQSLKEKLSDNQLKRIIAGSSGGGGTCAALTSSLECRCNISRKEAIFWACCQDRENGENCSGNWCCDSCSTASWIPGCAQWGCNY